ncbi:hypothetical protein ACLIN0_11180 [Pantoea agglomerans]|uniref:hypothetical protein n=1 Tax=Enterobacter agglomerans TaxID=549 RepID=UPI003986A69D
MEELKMCVPERKEAEMKLLNLLNRTLKNQSDIDLLMDLATKNEYAIPMKGIRHKFDSMEKQPLTQDDWNDRDTLMHYFGP